MKRLDVGGAGKGAARPSLDYGRSRRRHAPGTLTARRRGRSGRLPWTLICQAPSLRIQGISDRTRCKARSGFHAGTVNYRFAGNRWAATSSSTARRPPLGTDPAKKSHEGHLRRQNGHICLVSAKSCTWEIDAFPLYGLVDVEIKFRHEGLERISIGNAILA